MQASRHPLHSSRDPEPNLLRMLSGSGIEDEAIFVSGLIEVKHLIDGAGDRVKTPLADALPTEPVVLDEPNHGCLVGRSVVYEILPRPRRDDQQWLSRTVTAAADRVSVSSVNAGQRVACRATGVGARQRVR